MILMRIAYIIGEATLSWTNIYDAYIITTTGTSCLIDEVSDGMPYSNTLSHNLFYVQ